MAEAERRAVAGMPASQQPTDIEALPSLFTRLGDDVLKLLDAKLNLAKVEVKEDATAYARSGALIAVGAVVALVGFVLTNVAVACFLSNLFANDEPGAVLQRYGPTSYGLGFLITGILYLVVGGIVAYAGKNRMAKRTPAPERTMDELRKDKQWLKNEM